MMQKPIKQEYVKPVIVELSAEFTNSKQIFVAAEVMFGMTTSMFFGPS